MWIQESMRKGSKMKDHYRIGSVDVFIKDSLPDEIDASYVFDYINARIPFYLLTSVEIIYVGVFPEMIERDINAFYENDAIYVTSEQDDEMDMIDDIIHELSHAIEKKNGELIYNDSSLEREFLAKRSRLENLLKKDFKVPPHFSIDAEYDKGVDNFLYADVTYDILQRYIPNIFPTPYSVTSINEYWAIGFEEMFLGDRDKLKQLCPVLHNKLLTIIKELKENTWQVSPDVLDYK